MMRARLAMFTVAVGLLEPACPPSPQPPDAGDGGGAMDASLFWPASACENLADAGCKEGFDTNCVTAISRASSNRLTQVNVACLSTKHSKAELRACGFVVCP